MKIGVISDVHDNAHNLVLALEELESHKVEKIWFLGDFAGAAISRIMISSVIPIFAIWGNNDGDKSLITKFSLEEGSNLEVGFATFDVVEADKRKVFLTHFPLIAKSMAKSGEYNAVFYGHDHLKHEEKVGDCLLMNPGEIGAYKTGICSYAVYDTKDNMAKTYIVKDSVTTNTEISKKKFEEIKFRWNSLKGHKLN
ncbi:YfcE family phosphodiesterase [Candidatus Dojkabacteria bacterium]|nr:YfcE family phosphodiesterase [Candidatus Dojkabacteria bacterium]